MLSFFKNRPKVVIALLAVAVSLTAAFITVEQTSKPTFCTSCHEMQPAYETWTQSAHVDTSCMSCHADHGITGKLKVKLNGVRQVFVHLTGGVEQQSITAEVPDERCLYCHEGDLKLLAEGYRPPKDIEGQREAAVPVTTDGLQKLDVDVHHEEHLQLDNVTCTSCHERVVHTKVQGEVAGEAVMKLCLDCHETQGVQIAQRDALVTCAACHNELESIEPKSHAEGWLQGHGIAAARPDADCAECHQEAPAGTVANSNDDFCFQCHGLQMPHPNDFVSNHAEQFEEDASLCVTCHAKPEQVRAVWDGTLARADVAASDVSSGDRCMECHGLEMPHPENWGPQHGTVAQQMGTEACDTCHENNSAVTAAASGQSDGFCTQCHGVTMPHPASWLQSHGQFAQKNSDTCTTCHSPENTWADGAPYAQSDFCVTCHRTRNPHGSDWLSRHDDVFETQGDAYCRTCHVEQNACTNCHKESGDFHPDNWTLLHRFQAESNGVDSCETCHPKFDDCVVCHRDPEFTGESDR